MAAGGFKLNENNLSLLLNRKSFLDIEFNNYLNLKFEQIATIEFIKEKRWYYLIITFNENVKKLKDNENYVAIDLGTKSIATCYSNKINNLQIENTKFINLEKRIENLQRKLSNKKRYSKRYNRIKEILNKKYKKLSNKNKDFQHKVSRKIVNICIENEINTLIVGDIKTKKCINKYANKLNKNNQGRGTLSRTKEFLKYKSQLSGINFHLINEAYTSQFNCLTGKKEFSSNLNIREDEIKDGLIIDRDLNGAVNIYKKFTNEFKVEWSNHLQELLTLDKMYMDHNSNLYMIKKL